MSSSAERLAANTANAQHSTGPRTPQGQARSSQNARTHGLTARDLIVAPNESKEFEQLLNDYQTEAQPQGAIQQTLFDELVGAAWNLRRVRRLEVQLWSDTTGDDEIQKKLERLARHKTRIERTFHRSLKELKALQTNAVFQEALPSEMRPYVPALSNAAAISKRTQQVAKTNQLAYIKASMAAPMPQPRVSSPQSPSP